MDLLQHGPMYHYVVSKQYYLKDHPMVHHPMLEEGLASSGGALPLVEGGPSSGGGRFPLVEGGRLVVEGYLLWWRMGYLVICRYTLMPIQHIFIAFILVFKSSNSLSYVLHVSTSY